MATRYLTRAILSTTKPLTSVLSHSSTAAASLPNSSSIFRLRPLAAAATAFFFRRLAPAISTRGFASTRQTSPSLSEPNRPNLRSEETIQLDGRDFEHWRVVMEKPEDNQSRDEIIDSYIKTLAMVVGSEEEARMKIYSVSTKHYYAFGALVSEELSYRIKECPKVTWVLPDSYMDVESKSYGGEPFINGRAVPYDPKYHEEWVRNKDLSENRHRRNDRRRVGIANAKTDLKPPQSPTNLESQKIEGGSALESQPKGGAWMNEFKNCVDKLAEFTNGEIEVVSPDYSISAALNCLNEIEDIPKSSDMYLDACEILKDAGEREWFICLAPEMRRGWLQRALDSRRGEGFGFLEDADERERFVISPPERQRRLLLHRHSLRHIYSSNDVKEFE
ncbi:uncharacterized protein at3g15000 mitochondrial [Phtheirospermum japonicum]|uniref:Uncharacterized protein at3g15000 mitochondrial n=1 Tax=Phtheirospermum japonicum TaxID=374723 RepID=A0A830AW85_9LAMI|nr:uncharacterized protein at3g15000 mitochondrial [Phtheirospermum japonicum]